MSKFDALHAEIGELKTVRQSAGVLMDRLFALVLENKNDPAAIEALVVGYRAEREALTADVVRNTPVADEPPPPPPPPPVDPPLDPSASKRGR